MKDHTLDSVQDKDKQAPAINAELVQNLLRSEKPQSQGLNLKPGLNLETALVVAPLALAAVPAGKAALMRFVGREAESLLLPQTKSRLMTQALRTEVSQLGSADKSLAPKVFDLKDLRVDRLMSPARRLEAASASVLHDASSAQSFARSLRGEVAPLYGDLRLAYKPLAGWQRYAGALDKDVPEYAAFRQQTDRWQPVLQRHADALSARAGMPPMKVQISLEETGARGQYDLSTNVMQVNYRQLLRPSSLPEAIYHEGTHGEQLNVVVRDFADKLKIGKAASPAQLEQLGANIRSELQASGGFSADYLKQVLALRAGAPLDAAQSARAASLKEGFLRTGRFDNSFDQFQDEQFRQYLSSMPGRSFTDFLEKEHGAAAELLDSGLKMPTVTRKFLWDYAKGGGDLSRVDLASEQAASKGFIDTVLKVLNRNNDLRKLGAQNYRLSSQEVEAFENGYLTYGWRRSK